MLSMLVSASPLRPRLFIITVSILLLFVYFSQSIFLGNQDPFSPVSSAEARTPLALLPYDLIAAYKMRHAANTARYDIGIFGNSHVQEVGSEDFISIGRFFNFSMPASSMRQSTNFIEYLAGLNKLPKIIIIGVPNFDRTIQISPRWPSAPRRWINAAIESLTIWRQPSMNWQESIRLIVRNLRQEKDIFVEYINVRRAFTHFSFISGLFPVEGDKRGDYQADGHFKRKFYPDPRHLPVAGRGKRSTQPLSGVITYDLERIARVSSQTRVIIFEDSLTPESMHYFANNKDPYTEESRQNFLKTCKQLRFECHLAQVLGDEGASSWGDEEHPPGYLLSPYVYNLVKNKSLR